MITADEIAELRRWVAENAEIRKILRQDPAGPNDPSIYVLRLLDEVERSRALLKHIEWSAVALPSGDTECPECGAYQRTGHETDCELAALLSRSG